MFQSFRIICRISHHKTTPLNYIKKVCKIKKNVRCSAKDRRVYTTLTGILAEPPPAGGNGGGQPDGNDGRRTGLREQVGCVGRESRAWEADREERRSERGMRGMAAC
ncbi:hypothetical protein BEI63_26355 [Eisenbergiella tayi]|uniref:Uncharacterized protein n=1 Tax=Eisenbergiella tayi TaxID=1432052 RepID=A0ABX3A9B9_9FIRM|nr:hypothetical protein BEI63_26355 [Eisenbergiella tayi]